MTVQAQRAMYVGTVVAALADAGYQVAEQFVERESCADPDHVIRVESGGPIVDLIWDTIAWSIIVHPFPRAVASGELSQQLTGRADMPAERLVRLAAPIIDEARRRWGPSDGWVFKSGDGWQRYERQYGGGVTGVVHAIAAGLFTGSIRRPFGGGLALGRNYGFPAGHVQACAAVDAMHAKHCAQPVEPEVLSSVRDRVADLTERGAVVRVVVDPSPEQVAWAAEMARRASAMLARLNGEIGEVEDLPTVTMTFDEIKAAAGGAGYVCKSCGGPSPVGVGYVDTTDGAAARSAGLTVCGCGFSVKP